MNEEHVSRVAEAKIDRHVSQRADSGCVAVDNINAQRILDAHDAIRTPHVEARRDTQVAASRLVRLIVRTQASVRRVDILSYRLLSVLGVGSRAAAVGRGPTHP